MVRILPSLHLLCRSEIIFQFYGGIWLFLSRTICHIITYLSLTTFIRSKPKGSIDLRVPGTPTATEIYCGLVLEAWFWQCQHCEVHLGEEMFKLRKGSGLSGGILVWMKLDWYSQEWVGVNDLGTSLSLSSLHASLRSHTYLQGAICLAFWPPWQPEDSY